MKNSNRPVAETEGQEYLIPYLDRPWDPEDITVQDIKKYADDFFIQNMFMKLTNFIFLGPPTYNVIQKGKQREDLAEPMREMCKKIGFFQFLKLVWYDVCIWGNSLYSEGVDQIGTQWEYQELRSLPPELFAYPGGALVVPYMWGNYVMNPNYTYGRLLKGIERHDDETVHYWERMKYQIIELDNCKLIKSPVRSYFIDGIPLFLPLYKVLPKIYFALDQLMMHNNRSNMLFLTVDGKENQLLPDNKTSKWSYSQTVLKAASNKNSFVLPVGVEPTEFKQPSSDIHLRTIDLLTKWLISYVTPADIISKGDGSLIGGSSNYEAQLFKMFSESFQEYMAEIVAQPILDRWLAWNGWTDCHAEVVMKKLSFDNEELDFQIGQAILEQISKGRVIGDINEVRSKFRLENADVKFLQKSKAEWDAVTIEQVPVLRETLTGTDKELDASSKDMMAKEKPEVQKTEDEMKAGLKQEGIKNEVA